MWFMCFAVISYIGLVLLFPSASNIRLVITNLFAAIGCYTICLISTYWVIKQYYKQLCANIEEQTSKDLKGDIRRFSLEEILSTKDGFDLFANHLVKEFSIENLAFLFEVMQVKDEAINNGLCFYYGYIYIYRQILVISELIIIYRLICRESVGFLFPISQERLTKVRRRNSNIYGINDLKDNIRYIMEQYMYNGAEYGVNVSSFTRMTALNEYDQLGIRSIPSTSYRASDRESSRSNDKEESHSRSNDNDDDNPLKIANIIHLVTISNHFILNTRFIPIHKTIFYLLIPMLDRKTGSKREHYN